MKNLAGKYCVVTGAGKGIGKRFGTVIFFYLLTTFLAAAIAVIASFLFRVQVPLTISPETSTAPSGLGEVFNTLLGNMVANPISALINGNYIGILTWSVILGLALRQIASAGTKEMLSNLSDAVSRVVGWVIQLAPFGIMGLVFSSVSEYGLEIFVDYGKLLLVLVGDRKSVV